MTLSKSMMKHVCFRRVGVCFRLFVSVGLLLLPLSDAFVLPSLVRQSRLGMMVDLQELEQLAEQASEVWDVSVTPFLNAEEMEGLRQRLDPRADLGYIPAITPHSNPSRNRFIMTNPDNIPIIEAEEKDHPAHCVLLRVDRQQSDNSSFPSWPHVLKNIGIDLRQVGDTWTSPSSPNEAFLVVSPDIVQRCVRLLPKELYRMKGGTGLTVSVVDPEEYFEIDFLDEDESYAPMELGKLDERSLKYKSHPLNR